LKQLSGLAVLGLAGPVGAADGAPPALVSVSPGSLPILLTAPHGGTAPIPDVPERTSGVKVRDEYTSEIAEGVATRLEELLGGRPYLVIARFHRKFLDANRKESEALENPAAKPTYEAYHHAVRRFVDEIRRQHLERGLMIDVHGQIGDRQAIFRGTRDGLTVKRLLDRHGEAALTGPKSLFGLLQGSGYRVIPANTPLKDPPETSSYRGGHTVATYGSHNPDGIDAIQAEIGRDLRAAESRGKLIVAFADALTGFYREYLRG